MLPVFSDSVRPASPAKIALVTCRPMSSDAACGCKNLDVFEGHRPHIVPRFKALAIDPLGFKTAKPTFRWRVIPAISFTVNQRPCLWSVTRN